MIETIVKKLDLEEYFLSLEKLFARPKDIVLQGDINIHYKLIMEMGKYNFKEPKKVMNLNEKINNIKKQGVLKLYEIYEFVTIIDYFVYLKRFSLEGKLLEWIEKIVIPESIFELSKKFTKEGSLSEGLDEEYDRINSTIYNTKTSIKESLYKIINQKKLQPYLVDSQVHLVHGEQALLVRGGFNHVLKGKIIDRSSAGFFYVVPNDVDNQKRRLVELHSLKEDILYRITKEYSSLLNTHILFINFINKEFDRLDHYLARVEFAKLDDRNFILPAGKKSNLKLVDFIHPALNTKSAKSVSIDFSKSVIMITGVNAGGKTMLLKSILSSVLMSKYLIPYKCHKNTKVCHFKEVIAILDDPQSVKNDISTFAGRMVEFSKIFNKSNAIVGVDEIELGTDSDEAASLFKVIIERLMKKDVKIIITTHHKRLASLLAAYEEVDLVAALYDEQNRKPTYEFLNGTIGLSYAFETASRYGIPFDIIKEANHVYGEDKDKLNDLIARSSSLELEYQRKLHELDEKIDNNNRLQTNLNQQKEELDSLIYQEKKKLHREYSDVKEEAKKAIKAKMYQDSHRHLNKAHTKVDKIKTQKVEEVQEFKLNDRVKYNNTKGEIISIKGKKAHIQTDDGMKLQVLLTSLKPSGNPIKIKKKPKVNVKVEKPKEGHVKLDLHGQRSDEAVENLDKFLSDCLISGFDEVLVFHGIGTGKLAYAIKKFLDAHPKVVSYNDAPHNQGGFGAKIIKL